MYIVIAFCALWVTVFLCWVIYYIAMILRQAYSLTKELKEKMERIDEAIRGILEKIDHSSAYLALIADGAKYLVKHFTEKREEKRGRKKKIEI